MERINEMKIKKRGRKKTAMMGKESRWKDVRYQMNTGWRKEKRSDTNEEKDAEVEADDRNKDKRTWREQTCKLGAILQWREEKDKRERENF